eukprot:RCo049313
MPKAPAAKPKVPRRKPISTKPKTDKAKPSKPKPAKPKAKPSKPKAPQPSKPKTAAKPKPAKPKGKPSKPKSPKPSKPKAPKSNAAKPKPKAAKPKAAKSSSEKAGLSASDLDLLAPTKGGGTLVDQWVHDWNCYWDDSYETPPPEDRDHTFVFSPPLQQLRCGVVIAVGGFPPNPRSSCPAELAEDIALAHALGTAMKDSFTQWGEACDSLQGFVAVVPKSVHIPTPEVVASYLGMHGKLQGRICVIEPEKELQEAAERDNDGEEEGAELKAFRLLAQHRDRLPGSPLYFHAGSDEMNPCPLLLVHQSSHGNLVGLIGALVFT